MEGIITFFACFFPFFFAMNPIALMSTYIILTEGMNKLRMKKVIIQSMITALGVGIAFMFLGKMTFDALHIAEANFKLAGGALLFLISLKELVSLGPKNEEKIDQESVGAMPLGVPMIVGPGVLTAILILHAQHGYLFTAAAFVVAVVLAGLFLWFSQNLTKILGGKSGTKTLGKIIFLFLASMAAKFFYDGLI